MKKRMLITSLFVVMIVVLMISSLYLFPKMFASDEMKLLYDMRAILNSHITPKSYHFSDIYEYYFSAGFYKAEDNKESYQMNLYTEEDFFDVIADIDLICVEIKKCISSYRVLPNENLEVKIWIENRSNWSIPVSPLANRICVGINNDIPITDVLKYCKNFEEIKIGGYRGYKVSIPDNFNSDYFDGFDNLKLLQIDDFETKQDKVRAEKLSEGLEDVLLIIDYERIE